MQCNGINNIILVLNMVPHKHKHVGSRDLTWTNVSPRGSHKRDLPYCSPIPPPWAGWMSCGQSPCLGWTPSWSEEALVVAQMSLAPSPTFLLGWDADPVWASVQRKKQINNIILSSINSHVSMYVLRELKALIIKIYTEFNLEFWR